MDFLEKDLEEILYTSNPDIIFERGLECFYHHFLYRQFRIDGYGIIDLLSVSYFKQQKLIVIKIYELKNKELNSAAFWQIVRYVNGIQNVIKQFNLINHEIKIQGILIGRDIDTKSDFCFLPSIQSIISIYQYSYDIDGMKFREVGNNYFNTGFKPIKPVEVDSYSFFDFARNIHLMALPKEEEKEIQPF